MRSVGFERIFTMLSLYSLFTPEFDMPTLHTQSSLSIDDYKYLCEHSEFISNYTLS